MIVDKRLSFDIYDPFTDTWLTLFELPAWQQTVYAVEGKIKVSPDSLIFKPPLHGPKAFASVDKEYLDELKRTDNYLVSRTVNRLFMCGLSGDTLSEKRLGTIETDFRDYYASHPDSKQLLDEKTGLYQAYKAFLKGGGKQEYFDLSIYPYFEKLMKKGKQ